MKYNKLVRDNIPEIIKSKGDTPIIHEAGDAEYWEKLLEKLNEECNEFIESEEELEVADILEVINAICDFKGFRKSEIEKLRKKRAEARGGFEKRIILEEVLEKDNDEEK